MARDIKRKRFLDRFHRRKDTYMKNAEFLRADFGAKIYVVIQFHDKYHTYSSDENWPPSQDKLVCPPTKSTAQNPLIRTRHNVIRFRVC